VITRYGLWGGRDVLLVRHGWAPVADELRPEGSPGSILAGLRAAKRVTPAAAQLIYDTVAAVARFGRFPPPEGWVSWDSDVVQDVAHGFLTEKNAEKRFAKLVAEATDDGSFERLLQKAVRNHFRMLARATDMGATLRALRHAVGNDPEIIAQGSTPTTEMWTLARHKDQAPYTGRHGDLIDAAYSVTDAKPGKWASANRRSPITDPQSLRRVVHAVLDAAGGAIPPKLLVEVIVARFPLTVPGAPVELDGAIPDGSDPTARLAAVEVWNALTDNQRLLLWFYKATEAPAVDDDGLDQQQDQDQDHLDAVRPHKNMTVRQIAEASGLSKSTVQRVLDELPDELRPLLEEVDPRQHLAILRELRNMSSFFCARGTATLDSASTTAERT
jgi:hypothetical protein